ncbi:MAG TPA: TraR/DksA C4-type zinc finger protein [Bacillota bacterium]|nr:TraR/DksA C4-type zinc finger protein [Bacillota bacterium]
MNRQKLASIKERLIRDREHTLSRIRQMNEDGLAVPLQDSISELSSYDNHPADLGSETFERSKDFALREGFQLHIDQLDRALEALDQGTYGICSECGKPIPEARLEVLPEATRCVGCMEKTDVPDRHLRPIEEDVVVPPFGGFTHDNSPRELGDSEDENEFDGEDTWQRLAYSTEHAESSQAGSYYGGLDFDEDIGFVEDVDHLAYERGEDGMFYAVVEPHKHVDHMLYQDELPEDELEPYTED